MYIGASLVLSSAFGIPGLIYANCINMGIRIATSLMYAFLLEKDPYAAFRSFLHDVVSIDIPFIVGLVKERFSKKKAK